MTEITNEVRINGKIYRKLDQLSKTKLEHLLQLSEIQYNNYCSFKKQIIAYKTYLKEQCDIINYHLKKRDSNEPN